MYVCIPRIITARQEAVRGGCAHVSCRSGTVVAAGEIRSHIVMKSSSYNWSNGQKPEMITVRLVEDLEMLAEYVCSLFQNTDMLPAAHPRVNILRRIRHKRHNEESNHAVYKYVHIALHTAHCTMQRPA